MLLNASQVSEHVTLSPFSKLTQVGVDLSVKRIERIIKGGSVLKDKTLIDPEDYLEVPLINGTNGFKYWRLVPGAYALEFNEGCKIPANCTGFIQSRSSIYRQGSIISSPAWDGGFETEAMGTTLIVMVPITIEENARVGQFFLHENYTPETLYDGQWQNKTNY